MPVPDGFVKTPAPLADLMAGVVMLKAPEPGDRILYPGAGTGNIAEAVHRRFAFKEYPTPDGVAVEIDPERAEILRGNFVGESAPMNHGTPRISENAKQSHKNKANADWYDGPSEVECEFEVKQADFLKDPPNGLFEYIVANPPFVRYREIDQEDRELYADQFETAKGQFALYMPFVEQMMSLLSPDGVLAFLAPENYLFQKKARPLRNYLRRANMSTPEHIPDFAFPNHKITTVLTVVGRPCNSMFTNPKPPSETSIYVSGMQGYSWGRFLDRYQIPEDRRDDMTRERRDRIRSLQRSVRRVDEEEREMLGADIPPLREKPAERQSSLRAWV